MSDASLQPVLTLSSSASQEALSFTLFNGDSLLKPDLDFELDLSYSEYIHKALILSHEKPTLLSVQPTTLCFISSSEIPSHLIFPS